MMVVWVVCLVSGAIVTVTDCEEIGKALVVVTITVRSHRLAVRPEVCASGYRDTAAAQRERLRYVLLAQQTHNCV